MAKDLGKFRIWAEYAGLLFGYALLAWPPLPIARVGATILADLWRRMDRKHRLLATRQSMERLGIDEERARILVRDNYRHYGLVAMETARLKGMSPQDAIKRTNLNGSDAIMTDILSRGKGLIVITGHIGNWEWGGGVLGGLKLVEGMIARPLDNPKIDEFVRGIRQKTGASVWDKAGSMRKALATLKRGGCFVAVMDQDGGHTGCHAPFLGKDGSTMATPIELAIRTGAPLFVGAVIRDADSRDFNVIYKRIHWPEDGADPDREKQRLIEDVNADLSELIMAYPEQWIWIHKRWKTTSPKRCQPIPGN